MLHADPSSATQVSTPSDTTRASTSPRISERRLLLLLSAVQFVNVLDFMLVMPLGPDFARELHIPVSQMGWVGGAYTAAAAISGLASARFLDRFDRRSALATTLLGLVIGTALGGVARGLFDLMAARIVAGIFGGPASSLSLSIIADVVPPQRRGRAMGVVMGAFSTASVLGIPAALELSRLGGFRVTFFAVAAMGLLVAGAAVLSMPRLTLHLQHVTSPQSADVRGRDAVASDSFRLTVYAMFGTVTLMIAAFAVIPNLATYVQTNMHYPREKLSILYLAGGVGSLLSTRVIGPVVDRIGAASVSALSAAGVIPLLTLVFVLHVPLPVMLFYILFMISVSMRGVAYHALSSRVPLAHERARFLSLQSAVQHAASALGAVMSAELLSVLPDGSLSGMDRVGVLALSCAGLLPLVLWRIERLIAVRDRRAAASVVGAHTHVQRDSVTQLQDSLT